MRDKTAAFLCLGFPPNKNAASRAPFQDRGARRAGWVDLRYSLSPIPYPLTLSISGIDYAIALGIISSEIMRSIHVQKCQTYRVGDR